MKRTHSNQMFISNSSTTGQIRGIAIMTMTDFGLNLHSWK